MSKRKGKSLEEKRSCLLSIYHETCVPYNLKEIEKEGSRKGVVQQSIKDVNTSLVDDSLITTDKIGSGVFFWSFPSAALHSKKKTKESLENQLNNSIINDNILKESLREEWKTRLSDDRHEKLKRLEELHNLENKLKTELEKNKANDPVEIKKMEVLAVSLKDSANRWVDNTWALKTFLTRKRGISSKEADKWLGLKDDFDYFEDSHAFAANKKLKR